MILGHELQRVCWMTTRAQLVHRGISGALQGAPAGQEDDSGQRWVGPAAWKCTVNRDLGWHP